MMYSLKGRRYKPKEVALAGLYLVFLLATAGEFFYALKSQNHLEVTHDKIEKHEQIPVHLPEESKIEFVRMLKVRSKYGCGD